tara:strand:+ start:126 stop:332 length:207 start_codon:yes stop_codon:yes gene_type:complete
MKLILKLSLFLFVLFIFEDASLSLTDYQIKKICKNKQRVSICIKNLIEKRSKLQKGLFIEIPVRPYKR